MRFLIIFITLHRTLEACSNYPTFGALPTDSMLAKARGQSTHLVGQTGSTISQSSDLNCFDFDETCRWKNMEGLFVDELDWFQGSGVIDHNRLQMATGTNIFPKGKYAIVGTDQVQIASAKAVFVSDTVPCQRGPGQISFLYWTSPEVRIKVCTKQVSQVFPNFQFCSADIEAGDPGPAMIAIPDQGEGPFQIFIIAENFVFTAFNIQGGYAIIDNIEYEAELCDSALGMQSNEDLDSLGNRVDQTSAPLFPTLPVKPLDAETDPSPRPFIHISPSVKMTRRNKMAQSSPVPEEFRLSTAASHDSPDEIQRDVVPSMVAACEALTCSFNKSQICIQFAVTSSWMVSRRPVGNPLTGIRGDASELPFNREGSFAFINGPTRFSRLTTPPFYLDRNALFLFSYHKVDRNSSFRLYAKRSDSKEETLLFEAPQINKESRRWFREGRDLLRGQYDYIAFEVRNLSLNNYMGVDEWMIVDEGRRAFCQNNF